MGDWARRNDCPVARIDASNGRLPEHVLDRTRRAYYAQLAHLDYQVGRLRRYLKGRHLLDNTEKYIWNSQSGEEWFFDLEQDPTESRNLAAVPDARTRKEVWYSRLVDKLSGRPQDHLVEDGKLVSSRTLPATRDFLNTNATNANK